MKNFRSRRNHIPETHMRFPCHLHPSPKKAENVMGSADESDENMGWGDPLWASVISERVDTDTSMKEWYWVTTPIVTQA